METWRRAVLSLDVSLGDVIRNLNETGLRIVIIVNPDGSLVGTISDGDIRRSILANHQISDGIFKLINRNPHTVPIELTRSEVVKIMKSQKILQIPIVNERNQLLGLHVWDEMTSIEKLPNLFVIMAGGLGTRMLPKTKTTPKPMLQIGGKPILQHIIERAKIDGFHHFLISVNYLRGIIEDYFGNGASLGVEINYLRESEALGTAGSLSLIESNPKTPFLVTNGDVFTDLRYGALLKYHQEMKAFGTMAVKIFDWQNPYGVVSTNQFEIIDYVEKPISRSLVNAGVYVLDPNILSFFQGHKHVNMPEVFQSIRENGLKSVAYPIQEYWADIGQPDDLNNTASIFGSSSS